MADTPWYALPVSQGFYWTPKNTRAHSGIDLATQPGRPITAPVSGTQVSEGTEPWGGQENELIKDSSGQPEVLTWLHMSSEVPLAPGTPIRAGQLLGYSGTPPAGFGNGPHIHFERTAGRTPAYMGYNPWYPSSSSYPLNPQPVLDQAKQTNEHGSAALDLSSNYASVSGLDPFGVGAAFSGFERAVGQDVQAVQTTIADALKRAGVFIIGAILAIIGLVILFQPVISDLGKSAAAKAEGIAGAAQGAGKSAGGFVSGAASEATEAAEVIA